MNYEQKQQVVEKLGREFALAQATYVVKYQGCSCKQLTGLRVKLRPLGAKFLVVKNSLSQRALADTPAAQLRELFVGSTAVIWAENPVGAAKILVDFAKEEEKFTLKGGMVDGAIVDASGVEKIAAMPSKEELIARLLFLLNAPATKLLQMLSAPAGSLVRVLEAWRAKLPSGVEEVAADNQAKGE